MPLSSSAISQQEPERKAVELLNEFYKLFFCNAPVDIAGVSVTLPHVDLYFGVASPAQPAQKPQIHTFFSDWKPDAGWTGETKLTRAAVNMQIYVRAVQPFQPTSSQQTPDQISRRVADAVRQLFESEKIQLARKGIRNCCVRRGPKVMPMAGMSMRLLVVDAEFHYQAVV